VTASGEFLPDGFLAQMSVFGRLLASEVELPDLGYPATAFAVITL
jgi:hypothetical protein